MIEPLLKVLRMVDDDGSTNGYIYEVMDWTKEAIKDVLNGHQEKYSPFCKVINQMWGKSLHNHVDVVATNPTFHYEKRFDGC